MDPFATITMLGALRALMLALMLAVPIHGAATSVVLDSYSLNALYRPQVNGSLANTGAWNASFTGSPWSTKLFGAHGEGQGYHFAVYNKTLDPPYVQFDFYGTGIEFFGFWGYVGSGTKVSGGPGSTSIFVSGATYSGPQDIIFSGMSLSRAMDSAQPVSIGIIKDLPAGFYSVGLRVTGGTVSFTHAVIDAEFGATQSTMEVTRRNAVIVSPVKTTDLGELVRNDDFGNWTGAGWTVNADRRVLGTDKLNDSVLIDLGTGNYWMDLKGSRGTFASFFRYEISPAPPMLYERLTTLRAYSPWEVRNVSLLATTLDPAVRYTLSVTNLLNDGFDTGYEGLNKMMNWLELSSLELWNQHAGPSPAKEPPIAAIVGGTLGSVILCVVVGATAWWYMCGRRRRRRTISPEDNFEIDESPVAVSTPYVSPHSGRTSYFQSRSSRTSQGPLMGQVRNKHASMESHHMSGSSADNSVVPLKLREQAQRQSSYGRYSIDSGFWVQIGFGMEGSLIAGSGRIENDAPTFQSLDAGPVQPHTATPLEVPPSYNPRWRPPLSTHPTPPSTPGSIFIEGPPLGPRAESPDRMSSDTDAQRD